MTHSCHSPQPLCLSLNFLWGCDLLTGRRLCRTKQQGSEGRAGQQATRERAHAWRLRVCARMRVEPRCMRQARQELAGPRRAS